jgi:hypothetical protein
MSNQGVKFVEPRIPNSRVVENADQYDVALGAIRTAMNVVDQLTKSSITPKSRVNMVVILGIVFMI